MKLSLPAIVFILFSSMSSCVYGQICEAVLPHSLDTKRSNVGDQILLRTNLFTGAAESPITRLDASIVEIRSRARGRSAILRIQVNKAVRQDGHKLPVEAVIVAVISQSKVVESWDVPFIIADRFPRIPEDDERQPGERKLSEDLPHTSPLDLLPDVPILHRAVCPENRKKGATTCTNLLDARGTYGYKTAVLQPADPAAPSESVLTSDKNMSFPAGTVLVLEVRGSSVGDQSIKNEIHMRAIVQDVVALTDFSGRVTPVDFDPMFALTVRIESVEPAVNGFTAGSVVVFAIHSPVLLFGGDTTKGKKYDFSLQRQSEHDRTRFFGLKVEK